MIYPIETQKVRGKRRKRRRRGRRGRKGRWKKKEGGGENRTEEAEEEEEKAGRENCRKEKESESENSLGLKQTSSGGSNKLIITHFILSQQKPHLDKSCQQGRLLSDTGTGRNCLFTSSILSSGASMSDNYQSDQCWLE